MVTCFQDCWEAEDSLVLGLEQVASCHGQILDGLVEDEDEDVKEKLKQSIEALDCPVDALSDQLERAVERIVAVEREDKGGKQNGGIDGVMGLLSGYIKDIMSSLDVLKAGLCNLSVEGEEGQDRGGDVLRDLAMADCLEENFNLMVRVLSCIYVSVVSYRLISFCCWFWCAIHSRRIKNLKRQ